MTTQVAAWQQTINQTNLRIARENVGLSSLEATKKVFPKNPKGIDRVDSWEKAQTFPTYIQLEKLAYYYGLNVFQLMIKSNLKPTKKPAYFRTDKSVPVRDYNLYRFIDNLRLKQTVIKQNLKIDKASRHPLVGLGRDYLDPAKLADLIRHKLGYNISQKSPKLLAVNYLRSLLHEQTIFVFKTMASSRDVIELKQMRGLYLDDQHAPCIAINRRDFKRAQLFTLAHEVAHLFRASERLDSIDFRTLGEIKDKEEAFCNKVAANLLMPASNIRAAGNNQSFSLEEVKQLAEDHHVSNLVSLYRLSELGYLSSRLVAEYKSQLSQEYQDRQAEQANKPKKTGGNAINNMRDSNGLLFNEFVFSLQADGRLSTVEAQNLLGLPFGEI